MLEGLEHVAVAIVVTAPDGSLVYANRSARDLRSELGAPVEGFELGDVETAALAPGGAPLPLAQRPTELTRTSGRPCTEAEIGVTTLEGTVRWLRASTRRLDDEDGPPYGVVSSYSMVPEPLAALSERPAHDAREAAPYFPRRRTEEELRQAREQFSTAFSHAPIGMALVSPQGRLLRVNQALCELVGYSEPELLSRSFADITHPDDVEVQQALMREVLAGHRTGFQMDKRYVHADGRIIWVSLSLSMVTDESARPLHLIGHIVDVTERHRMEQRLQHLADHDPLTGLLNRRRFEEELIRQLDRCRRYHEDATLVMIDVDHFKQVNDTLGHAAGDEALQSIAAAIMGKVRSSDIIARVGGDEFAAILVGVDEHNAHAATSALAAVVREHDGSAVRTTVSVGATLLLPTDRPDTALFRADEALYWVKAAGRDGARVHVPGAPPPSDAG
jgi:diguanylate cyclase (GGDEF)-like protein/PAS domain S-box-containing protein